MEYTKRRRYTINVKNNIDYSDLQNIYQHDLHMYDFPPTGEISLTEFEELGRERLKLLQHVENNAIRTDFKTQEDRKQNLHTALMKDGLKYFAHLLYAKGCKSSTEIDLQCRRKDHISHFISRLSHCQESDRQMWFINQEIELFKLRFSSLDKEGIEKLLSMHNIDCQQAAKMSIMRMHGDDRIQSYLKSVPNISDKTCVVWTSSATPTDKLDELSKTSYPMCMRILHEALKSNHHLKNSGRIQYGLFIKGIGVTMEDSLSFWKTEFTKKIDSVKFDKEYAYTIRHTYGKEGRQTNYTPLGCQKIMSSVQSPGEFNGCPYKHMDNASLKQKLFSYGIPAASINEITELAKNDNYFGACTAYFKVLHNRLPDKPIIHPNGYFLESRAILTKDAEFENKEKLSQTGKLNVGTPRVSTPNIDRSTPSRNISTPKSTERNTTPSRKIDKMNMTPVRTSKLTPRRIENYLNDEDIEKLMSEDM
ncbi:DNA primase large subunit-like isoform X2 [Apis laboriosa]|uniref:DNA primase large subunit-like isoform X2 n=1 Tax=Apis laboriosa TaxID=183418 RepID=UPI001CC51437|nr:DNA primase large subunit-like isoform X2 [Apis laboriosa]